MKHWILVLLVSLLLLVTVDIPRESCGVEINDQLPFPLSLDDFSIGGIYLEQPIEEVIEIYGNPEIKDSVIYKENDPESYKCYDFDGITIEVGLYNNSVQDIRIERSDLETPRGIHVGDTIDKMISAYGNNFYPFDDTYNYQYYDKKTGFDYCLDFQEKDGFVCQIKVYYAWD